jgi:hypothetical protein
MRIAALVAAAWLGCACSPSPPAPSAPATTETSTAAAADAPVEFQLAGGNIGCNYVPAGGTETYQTPDGGPQLICDRVEPSYIRYALSAHGQASRYDHVGDASCCGGEMLAAGAHWAAGPFGCELSEDSVICSNADRLGFTLGRTQAD